MGDDTETDLLMSIKTIALLLLLMYGGLAAQELSVTLLVQPGTLIVDHSLPQDTLAPEILAARRCDTFGARVMGLLPMQRGTGLHRQHPT